MATQQQLAIATAFQGNFPLTAQFRSPPRNPVSSYEKWEEKQFMPEGFPVDVQTNVLRLAPENYEYANRFAKEHPEMLILSTWRAASGNPKGLDAEGNGDPLGQSVIEFPGHFVLSPGSYLTGAISPHTMEFHVEDGDKMVKGPALLVETDNYGRMLWDRFEYIRIKRIDDKKVTVGKRAFNGSPSARSFASPQQGKRTYIAPMPWDFRVNAVYTDWFFNLSNDCPLDEQNRTAMDVILNEMVNPLKAGGKLSHIGGIDLASGPLVLTPTNADYNVDGVEDSPEEYRKGVKKFYRRVWEVLGDSRALITELDYDMMEFINGVNQEGLAKPYDPWKEVSRTVNNVLAWKVLSDLPMVSLAFVQYLNKEEDLKRVQMHRLLNGYAVCLGMAADVDRGDGLEALERMELFKGADKEQHWLGKSVRMVRPASRTPNLLLDNRATNSTSSNDWTRMWSNLDVLRADLIVENDELVIRPYKKHAGYVTLIISFELPEETDLTVFFEARSDDENTVRHIKLPNINVEVETGPVRATISNIDYLPIGYFMRGVKAGSKVSFSLRFENGGDIRVKNLSVHSATDTLACEFEKGVVLVNPSLNNVSLNLKEIFPHREGYSKLKASEVDKGKVPSKYISQYEQAMALNDGQPLSNPESVTVLERNALFLLAEPTVRGKPTRSATVLTTTSSEVGSSATPATSTDVPPATITDTLASLDAIPTSAKPSSTKFAAPIPSYHPTLIPASTLSFTPACKDAKNKFELEPGTMVGCWYVTRAKGNTPIFKKRCSKATSQGPSIVSNFCPRSCNTCECQDSKASFRLLGSTSKNPVNCGWTLKKPEKTRHRCSSLSTQFIIVSDICPRACGLC